MTNLSRSHARGPGFPVGGRRAAWFRAAVTSCTLLVTACGASGYEAPAPADIAGTYSVTLTNAANGCEFLNWTTGSAAQNVPVVVAQSGTSATATVQGLASLVLGVALGTTQFQGTVDGDTFDLTAFGSTPIKGDGQCTFTIKATFAGSISGDAIQGQLTYSETTNGSPDCSYHATCNSVQTFAGVRPQPPDGG